MKIIIFILASSRAEGRALPLELHNAQSDHKRWIRMHSRRMCEAAMFVRCDETIRKQRLHTSREGVQIAVLKTLTGSKTEVEQLPAASRSCMPSAVPSLNVTSVFVGVIHPWDEETFSSTSSPTIDDEKSSTSCFHACGPR